MDAKGLVLEGVMLNAPARLVTCLCVRQHRPPTSDWLARVPDVPQRPHDTPALFGLALRFDGAPEGVLSTQPPEEPQRPHDTSQ
jgi:hypothetical protein